jgi:hypothetical protein
MQTAQPSNKQGVLDLLGDIQSDYGLVVLIMFLLLVFEGLRSSEAAVARKAKATTSIEHQDNGSI